ncbi:universal stress protein [Kriegella sp. EG-1]|nr:universal stress protein [Flavobacteriaceae bacterium EG-1]
MKNILFPTDFSDNAFNALLTAIKLQKGLPCNFTIIHVYTPDKLNIASLQGEKRTGLIFNALYKDAVSRLEKTLKTLEDVTNFSKHSFSINAISGDLASVINELVTKKDLDFIVMGTKGATGAKQIFLGSNTVRVLKKIRNCPILAIPSTYNFQSLKRIVFPTEYAHYFSKNQLSTLIKLAEAWSSELLVLHVAQEFKLTEKQNMNKNLLQERISYLKNSFHNIDIHSTVTEAITAFAKKQSADMICLIHYNHTFMEKLTQEPVVTKVGFTTDIPLLVLPV